ncbi:MAG: alanine--tRNA ligase [Saprospiraceae bacterium]|uniref:Alanine--tRNA ligase n=1 Tax=Candidatus Defluviibacterium haderslevense TaxID=2981993 RepID=A0A9D7SDD2_9BACT|nr:alanine--tRNA ligase [Candidatus Defluviibacterium haderslevense]
MESRLIRQTFLDFFAKNGHKIVPSAPIVVKNDPTLMFTNAGMNQFKDYFLGNKLIDIPRIADTQKCLRVSGKHNDLEEVGTDGYHHTMFEMLGNWSFGDYFKEEAIAFAWKLLTEAYKLDPSRLYISVFGGDAEEGLSKDLEAVEFWKKWVPEERILFFGKKDNFWEMGESGPCGPCSEIHVDLRPDDVRNRISGANLVNVGTPEVMEIWNLVFIQYNRKVDGQLEELPAKHIDTGMGFERISMVLQHKTSSYDTDIFSPLIQYIATFSGHPYTASYAPQAKSDLAMRVIADHIRAITFTIADGSIPSNTGSGYVIRRILRRAVRYYYSFLGIKDPFLFRLIPILVDTMGEVFPEIKSQQEFIIKVVHEEEISFLRTLEGGLKKLDQLKLDSGLISGSLAFELYDTYGFPLDLTKLIAAEKNWTIDEAGFKLALDQQKQRSRADAKKEYSDWNFIQDGQCKFIGYDVNEVEQTKLLRWRKLESKGNALYQLVLETTPFYPEGGGQVGDKGLLYFDGQAIEVLDTVKENDLILHIVEILPQHLEVPVRCVINGYRRSQIENNHSATHLMHAALRNILGTHVQQKGSLVNEDYLRFDFSHFQKLSSEEIKNIETLVNEKIRENIALEEKRHLPIEEAKQSGAMMLFGEKYGDYVRMITFDPGFSRELCGGCHVESTGNIGLFKIVSEASVAAGIRRIEAVSSSKAEQYIRDQMDELNQIKAVFNNPPNMIQHIHHLLDENKSLHKQIQDFKEEQSLVLKDQLLARAERISGIQTLFCSIVLTDSKLVKSLIYQLGKELSPAILFFGFVENDKAQLMCYVSEELVKTNQYNASNWLKQVSKHIEGGGGGQAFFATAGGKNVAGIQTAIEAVKDIVIKELKA